MTGDVRTLELRRSRKGRSSPKVYTEDDGIISSFLSKLPRAMTAVALERNQQSVQGGGQPGQKQRGGECPTKVTFGSPSRMGSDVFIRGIANVFVRGSSL